MSTTRINDNDLASVALYDKVNAIANEIDEEKVDYSDFEQLDNEAAKLTGDQTIDGIKSFTDIAVFLASTQEKIRLKSTTIDIDVNPTSAQNNQLWFVDKNGYQYATLQANQNTDGSVSFALTMKSKKANNYSSLNLTQFADGTAVVTAPTPPIGSNTTHVATTAWFNSKIQTVSTLPASPDSNVIYLIP